MISIATIMSSVEKIEQIGNADKVIQPSISVEYLERIEQLEQQVAEVHSSTLQVSVADMTRMYSNHLNTIDSTFSVIAFFILLVGSVVGFIGWKTIKDMIQNKVDKKVGQKVDDIIEKEVKPLRQEYEKFIAKQKEQDKKQDEKIEKQNIRIQVEHYMSEGNNYYNQGIFSKAIGEYSKAIKRDPNNVHAYVNRGNAKAGLKQYDKAIEDYDKAIGLDANNVHAYVNRGVAKVGLKQYENAIEDYDKAIGLDPNNVNAYVNRGNAKAGLKQYENAIEDYDKAIGLDPNNAGAYFNKACAYSLMEKEPEETLKILKKAIELDSKYKKMARDGDGFVSLRDNPKFRKLVGLDDKS